MLELWFFSSCRIFKHVSVVLLLFNLCFVATKIALSLSFNNAILFVIPTICYNYSEQCLFIHYVSEQWRKELPPERKWVFNLRFDCVRSFAEVFRVYFFALRYRRIRFAGIHFALINEMFETFEYCSSWPQIVCNMTTFFIDIWYKRTINLWSVPQAFRLRTASFSFPRNNEKNIYRIFV